MKLVSVSKDAPDDSFHDSAKESISNPSATEDQLQLVPSARVPFYPLDGGALARGGLLGDALSESLPDTAAELIEPTQAAGFRDQVISRSATRDLRKLKSVLQDINIWTRCPVALAHTGLLLVFLVH